MKLGGLAQHRVPLVQKGLGQQVHHLLGAAGDENVVALAPHLVLFLHVPQQMLPQRGVALGNAVLQRLNGGVLQQVLGDGLDRVVGEGVGSGVSRGQRDHVGVGGILQNLPDGGRLQALHTL